MRRQRDHLVTRLAALGAAAILALLGATAASPHDNGHSMAGGGHGAAHEPTPGATAFERRMNADMLAMTEAMHAPRYTGDPDVDFLAMMIPHHQGAVDMARLVLVHGDDPLTRRLAEGIIANQRTEVAAMRGRLAMLRAKDSPDAQAYPVLSGTRGLGGDAPPPGKCPAGTDAYAASRNAPSTMAGDALASDPCGEPEQP